MKYDITIDSHHIKNCTAEHATSMIQQMLEINQYDNKFTKQNLHDLVSRPERANKVLKHFLKTRQLVVKLHVNYMPSSVTKRIIKEELK